MSLEALQALVVRVSEDERLRNELLAGSSDDVRLGIIQAEGFDVTADDLAELRRQISVELSDEDLQNIAGGGSQTEDAVVASLTVFGISGVTIAAGAAIVV